MALGEAGGSDNREPLVYLADGGRMILPNEANLLNASLARRDDDLMVGGADRPVLVILDYFAADRRPDLQPQRLQRRSRCALYPGERPRRRLIACRETSEAGRRPGLEASRRLSA